MPVTETRLLLIFGEKLLYAKTITHPICGIDQLSPGEILVPFCAMLQQKAHLLQCSNRFPQKVVVTFSEAFQQFHSSNEALVHRVNRWTHQAIMRKASEHLENGCLLYQRIQPGCSARIQRGLLLSRSSHVGILQSFLFDRLVLAFILH